MNDSQISTHTQSSNLAEQVAVAGDLSQLSAEQRMAYYGRVCDSLGINPFTRPFEYIKLNNKLVLYATRTAADQLRRRNGVSLDAPRIEFADGLVIVTVTGRDDQGRTDTEIGAVALGNLQGEARANAIMKAVTKAKRRLTLSICGLGWLDETEVETIRDARPVTVTTDGVIVDSAALPPPSDEDVTIREASAREFIAVAAGLLDTDAEDVKTRLRELGYSSIPGAAADRVKAYRALKAAPVAVIDDLFSDAEPVISNGAYND